MTTKNTAVDTTFLRRLIRRWLKQGVVSRARAKELLATIKTCGFYYE